MIQFDDAAVTHQVQINHSKASIWNQHKMPDVSMLTETEQRMAKSMYATQQNYTSAHTRSHSRIH